MTDKRTKVGKQPCVVYGRTPRTAWIFNPGEPDHEALLALKRRLLARGYRLVPPPLDLQAFAAADTPASAWELARLELGQVAA